MAGKQWTQEEQDKLKEFVSLGKYSFGQMAVFFPGRTPQGLQGQSRALNLNARYKYHIHTFDEFFFEKPNYINCFWAGWLVADGCLTNYCGERYSLKWRMHHKDKYFLQLFKEHIKYTGDITEIKSWGFDQEKDIPIIHNCICINRVDVGKLHLNKFGITPDKTYRIPGPSISEIELKLAFLVGYINGDGCINYSSSIRKSGYKQETFVIQFASSSVCLMNWIKDLVLALNLPRKRKNRFCNVKSVSNHFILTIAGLEAVYLFKLLSKINVPILERKWLQPKVLDYISRLKEKHPEWFSESIEQIMTKNNIDLSKFSDNYPRKIEISQNFV